MRNILKLSFLCICGLVLNSNSFAEDANQSACLIAETKPIPITPFAFSTAYPIVALKNNIGGSVKIVTKVDDGGNVIDVTLIGSHPYFEGESVRKNAMGRKFKPATKNCSPIEGEYIYIINFSVSNKN